MRCIGKTVAGDYFVEMSEDEYGAFCALSDLADKSPVWSTWNERSHSLVSDLTPVFVVIYEFAGIQRSILEAIKQLQTIKKLWEKTDD